MEGGDPGQSSSGGGSLPNKGKGIAVEEDKKKKGSNLQDRLLPSTDILRIMRKVLPVDAVVGDDAKETVQQCVAEFIGYITADAGQHCRQDRRRTVTAEDMVGALARLGFDQYTEYVTLYLDQCRELQGEHRPNHRDLLAEEAALAARGGHPPPPAGNDDGGAHQGHPAGFFPEGQ